MRWHTSQRQREGEKREKGGKGEKEKKERERGCEQASEREKKQSKAEPQGMPIGHRTIDSSSSTCASQSHSQCHRERALKSEIVSDQRMHEVAAN